MHKPKTAFCDRHFQPRSIRIGDTCYRISPQHITGKICCSHRGCGIFIDSRSNHMHSLWVRWDYRRWSKLIPYFHPGWASKDPRYTRRGL